MQVFYFITKTLNKLYSALIFLLIKNQSHILIIIVTDTDTLKLKRKKKYVYIANVFMPHKDEEMVMLLQMLVGIQKGWVS